MALPVIIFIIVVSVIAIFFIPPIGDPVFNALDGISSNVQSQQDPQMQQEQDAESNTDSLGIENTVKGFFEGIGKSGQDLADKTNVESLNLPNNPSNQEMENLITDLVNLGNVGASAFFAIEAVFEDLVLFGSPIPLAMALVSIISAIAGIFFLIFLFKKIGKHGIILLVMGIGLIIFILVVGSNIQI